jgi:hypothetical protein
MIEKKKLIVKNDLKEKKYLNKPVQFFKLVTRKVNKIPINEILRDKIKKKVPIRKD